ncbi:MAG TPA: cupredoxin domain-containing protein [Pseudolabrys sp.]|nr:cupredoxin domain-containing protein [Pseudolabrys sp.]
MTLAKLGLAIALTLGLSIAGSASRAQDAVTLNIAMKDHRFQPAELHAPAGKAIVIVVKNLDPAPAEFESNMLRVEKVVTGGGTITLRIRPLEPGRYRFFDDFHPETEGYLVVK